MKSFWSLGLVSALGVAGLACGPTDTVCEAMDTRPACTATADNPVVKILVTPDGVLKEVDLDSQSTYNICYRARAQFKNGQASDITNAAFWTLDRPEMGSFMGNCLTTADMLKSGGIIKVQASLMGGSSTGFASLVIKLRGTRENDGVGAGDFGGAPNTGADAKPRLVYPLDGSMHPRNITQMNIQFTAGAGNDRFRARFVSSQLDYTTYFKPTSCDGDRCQWQVPEDLWKLIALTNGGATAKVTLSGSGSGGKVAQSDVINIAFSPDDVIGGLYYFSTSLPGILRMPFVKGGTAKQATPFVIPNTKSNPKDCAGCHDITQDGTKITATYGHGDDFIGIASGSDAEMFSGPVASTRSNFQWFNKDGTKIIANFNGELILRDGNTGAELGRVNKADVGPDGKQRAVMPEWSHDSSRIVFVRLLSDSGMFYDSASCCGKKDGGDWLITDAGEICTITYDSGNFGTAKLLVGVGESKDFHYYPTWSPDDAWVVFNSGNKPGFSPIAQDDSSGFSYGVPKDKLVSYDQKTSRLRMVRASGGGVIELANATVGPGLTTSWPKFTPFVQKGGKLMFFTYSSKMDYGFVVTGGKQPQIWMAALDIDRIGENSQDPSFAPFWLPFQDAKQANHIGIWTTKIACEKDTKCGMGEFCQSGQCLPKID